MDSIASGLTESDGKLKLTLPADAKVGSVFALKSGRGLDYWIDRIQPGGPAPDLPEKLALVLNGARRVRVQAIDSEGQPVSGISVRPWTIQKQGRLSHVNLSGGFVSRSSAEATDAKGIATLDWIPIDFSNQIPFLIGSRDFCLADPPSITNDIKDDVELTLTLQATHRNLRHSSDRRRHASRGYRSAGGREEGQRHYFQGLARTKRQGNSHSKRIRIRAYLVAVLDEKWAAPSRTIPKLAEASQSEPLTSASGSGDRSTRSGYRQGRAGVRKNATVTLVQTASSKV